MNPTTEAPNVEALLLEQLQALNARLQRIEAALKPLSGLLAQAPALAATGVDVLDHAVAQAQARGLEPQARLDELGRLLEEATTPETLEALREALELLKSTPALAATATDVIDGAIARMAERGIVLDERVQNALRALDHLTHPDMVDILEHALRSGSLRSLVISSDVLSPEAVHVIGCAARALIETRQAPPARAGVFAALGAMRKPEVQTALGFGLTFAEHFGRRLAVSLDDCPAALTTSSTHEERACG